MPLVTVSELLRHAEAGGYAVGAFNCNNMEIVQAIVQAAEAERAPVIIQASQGAIRYAGLEYVAVLALTAAQRASVPMAVHLDHGLDFEQVVQCVRAGFTSVMFDGSRYPLKENIRRTRQVVEICRAVGVSVEGEIGRIGGVEDQVSVSDREAMLTDPEEAKQFAEATGVDSLAVAIGTAHGQYKGVPKLDFDRLRAIKQLVSVPIVLHGASGVSDEALRQAVKLGVRKINIDTNIREAFVAGVKSALEADPDQIDPRKILGPARERMQAVVREKIRVFGSSGQA
ncbi:MAG: class II fructose-1,6-bisphosphate aldolase [Clostridia bacterium]|nr:class II fructose-1,6-bisphosphate aldolase [Clostridia bacterium]